jgi:predicted HAD superfamily Cof-like phosphohydrolase
MEKQQKSLAEVIDDVRKFHDAFRVNWQSAPSGQLPNEVVELRHRLMREENDEYLEAAKKGDIVEIADALGDQLYILCGTIITHGLQDKIAEVFDEIQRSNMSKLDENGAPIFRADGKVLKSNLYFRPNIAKVLEEEWVGSASE